MANAKRNAFLWASLTISVIVLVALVSSMATASTNEVAEDTAMADTPADPSTAAGAAGPLLTADVQAAAVQRATGSSGLAPSIAAGQRIIDDTEPPIYSNDFSNADDFDRIDHFVHYRDPFVVNHSRGTSDHSPTGGVNCTGPGETRPQTKDRPQDHVYLCFPGGDPDKGHAMAYAMDSSGYGFVGGLPDQVFEEVREVSVDINTTSAGSRNFVEIKVLPANEVYVNAMPCGPDLPCNEGWDYDDIGGVGASTDSQDGTGLNIATPDNPHGVGFDQFATFADSLGTHHEPCQASSSFCFSAQVHSGNASVADRFRHVFRDNQDGTISFGIVEANGQMSWVTTSGSFPSPARVVVAFHNYTGTKDGNGPGFDNNQSPSTGGFTWHWDNLDVVAESATPTIEYFGGVSADRIVTRDDCVSFSQGQRGTEHSSDISPEFHCN